MVKDVLSALDYSAYAEVALLLFTAAFALSAFCMAKMTRDWSRSCAEIPLRDGDAEAHQ